MENDSRYFEAIKDMVFADEESERIESYIKANKLSDDEAQQILTKARAQRCAYIRKKGVKKLSFGLLGFAICAVFAIFSMKQEDPTTRKLMQIAVYGGVAGTSLFIATGLMDIIGAAKRTGGIPNKD